MIRTTLKIMLLALGAGACAAGASLSPGDMDQSTYERELAARFQYGPPQPVPIETDDRAAGQVVDAEYLAAFPDYDRAYNTTNRAMARRLLTSLRQDAASLSHEQFVLRVAEIAALADNGHTSIDQNAFMKNTARLPLRTYLFADGLHVLRADQANADLLGARIDRIDGYPVDEVYQRIRRYAGGVEARRRRQLIPMLESPRLLAAAGLAREGAGLTLSGVLANGAPFERHVTAEERDRSAPVSSTARLLFPVIDGGGMQSFLTPTASLPPYLRDPTHLFSTDTLPGGGLYVALAHNNDADEGPVAAFLETVMARVRTERPQFVVLDMRMNGGGDYTKTYAFARALPEAAAGRPIYVLTSAGTFSAAITTVAALKDAGGDQVVLVGEPVGDRLDFWAEGGAFSLPNAFVTVFYAAGRHHYDGPCTDRETCFWLNDRYPVRVANLTPDIPAPLTFAAYLEGRDPALERVLERERR